MVILFLFTVLVTALCLARIAGFAYPRNWTAALVIGIWLALTLAVAASGILRDFTRFPPRVMLLVVSALILTAGLAFSRVGARLAQSTPLYWLIGYQAFRIAVEIFLAWGAHSGIVPPQMTIEGRNWDLVTGLTAIATAWLAAKGRLGRRGVFIWNCLGLGLLVNVMSIAVLSMPTPLRQWANEPANTFITGAPYIWLPTFLVPAALFGHLLVFRRLASQRG